MRFETYLRAVDDEATIRALHQETNLPGACIKPLKARKEQSSNEVWWLWRTPCVKVHENQLDEAVKGLLEQYRPWLPVIRKYAERADIYLEVVGFFDENEPPRGLYLSAESLSLLNELGGALD